MKYEHQIIIDKPRAEVVALFESPDNMKHWQEGFVSMEHLSGEKGAPGAKSALVYQMGKRRIEMTETIEVNNLPEEFTAIFEAQGVWNRNRSLFSETPDGKTVWRQCDEFRFSGMMKLLGWIMPGAFRKQSLKYLTAFKDFAEGAGA